MKTKRITKLSDIHKLIGNFLYMHGDADVTSIATHTNSDSNDRTKYSFHLHPINSSENNMADEEIIFVNYDTVMSDENNTMVEIEKAVETASPLDSSAFEDFKTPCNGLLCELCGEPVRSTSAVVRVCNKCASEYKF